MTYLTFHIPNDGRWTGTITIDTFGEVIDQTGEVQVLIVLVEDAQEGVDVEQDERQRHGKGLHDPEGVGEHPGSVGSCAEAEHRQVDVPDVPVRCNCPF